MAQPVECAARAEVLAEALEDTRVGFGGAAQELFERGEGHAVLKEFAAHVFVEGMERVHHGVHGFVDFLRLTMRQGAHKFRQAGHLRDAGFVGVDVSEGSGVKRVGNEGLLG